MTAPHPGLILRNKIIALGISQERFATGTGIHFVTLNRLIKGHERFQPREALILAKALSLSPKFFLLAQVDHEVAVFLANPDQRPRNGGAGHKKTFAQAFDGAGVFE